jgi:hypothetical protein
VIAMTARAERVVRKSVMPIKWAHPPSRIKSETAALWRDLIEAAKAGLP